MRNMSISKKKDYASPSYQQTDEDEPSDMPSLLTFLNTSSHSALHEDKKESNTASDEYVQLKDLESLLNPADLVPTKLTENGCIDWSYYNHMMLYHTRKAGGSSLYVWAKQVAKKHNLTIHQQEGTTYDPHDAMGRKTFVFTSLRPPVERAVSSYEYDWLQTSHHRNEKGQNNTIDSNESNTTTSTTLREFFDHANNVNNGVNGTRNQRNVRRKSIMGIQKRNNRKRGGDANKLTRGWIWACATNCYSKWFGGWPKPLNVPDTKAAVQHLDGLEIVWMSNYQNLDYMKWFLHRWDAEDIPMVHKRKTANRVKQNFTEAEMNLLLTSNRNDRLLYEALRKKWSRVTNISLM